MRLLVTLCALLFSIAVLADERKVAVINSDIDKDIYNFYLITNDQDHVDSLRYQMVSPSGQILEDNTFPAETVIQDGIVLVRRNGHDAVRLEVGRDFNVENGGTVILDYLFSGVTGNRRKHNIRLQRLNGRLELTEHATTNIINKMFVYGNWNRLLGLIGVREIKTSFQAFQEE